MGLRQRRCLDSRGFVLCVRSFSVHQLRFMGYCVQGKQNQNQKARRNPGEQGPSIRYRKTICKIRLKVTSSLSCSVGKLNFVEDDSPGPRVTHGSRPKDPSLQLRIDTGNDREPPPRDPSNTHFHLKGEGPRSRSGFAPVVVYLCVTCPRLRSQGTLRTPHVNS